MAITISGQNNNDKILASDNDKKTAGGMAEEVKNDNFIPSDYRPGL